MNNQLKLHIIMLKTSDPNFQNELQPAEQSTVVIYMSQNYPEIHYLVLKCNISPQAQVLANSRGLGSVRRGGQTPSHETK